LEPAVKIVNVHEAKSQLSALLAQVEQGEEIVIARNGVEVAKLVRVERPPRREAGSWRKLPGWAEFRYDPALFAAMSERDMADEGWI
jgi:prevent-host-death family protein